MDVLIDCPCPPKSDGPRHEQDTVTLRERLDFRSGVTLRNAVGLLYNEDPDATWADVSALLTEQYLLLGIESWTLVDDKGDPVGVTKPTIRSFLNEHNDQAYEVGSAVTDLYYEQVISPLVKRAQESSPDSPIDESTSAKTGSSEQPPTPSKPSLITTSQTVDTEPITPLPAGDSSSSQNSASAA